MYYKINSHFHKQLINMKNFTCNLSYLLYVDSTQMC